MIKHSCVSAIALMSLLVLAGIQAAHAKSSRELAFDTPKSNSLADFSATRKTENCPSLFSSFKDFETEQLGFMSHYTPDVPDSLAVIKDPIDLDQDGDVERVLLAHKGSERDITNGPASTVLIISRKNPAFFKLTLNTVSVLFKPSNVQNAQQTLHYTYLSFHNFLQPMSIKGAKATHVAWSNLQYQKYFQSKRFPRELTEGTPISLRATLVRVGTALGSPYLHLSAKPVEFAEDGNTLLGYDENGYYVGRRFEFLGTYNGSYMLDLICARTVLGK